MSLVQEGEADEGEDHHEESPESVLKEGDSNHDGKISLAELQKHIEDLDGDLAKGEHGLHGAHPDQQTLVEIAEMKKEIEAEKAHMAGVFTKADLNKDGFIDAKELPAMLQAINEADAAEGASEKDASEKDDQVE